MGVFSELAQASPNNPKLPVRLFQEKFPLAITVISIQYNVSANYVGIKALCAATEPIKPINAETMTVRRILNF